MTRITIDDDMVERAARAVFGQSSLEQGSFWGIANPRAAFRTALEAALDRRTGPKDRRVEQDDTRFFGQRGSDCGRRDYDDNSFKDLPRKSDRLKREAKEREKQKAQEIHVSEGMLDIAFISASSLGWGQPLGWGTQEERRKWRGDITVIYRAMRLQEMKERGQ